MTFKKEFLIKETKFYNARNFILPYIWRMNFSKEELRVSWSVRTLLHVYVIETNKYCSEIPLHFLTRGSVKEKFFNFKKLITITLKVNSRYTDPIWNWKKHYVNLGSLSISVYVSSGRLFTLSLSLRYSPFWSFFPLRVRWFRKEEGRGSRRSWIRNPRSC